MTTVVFTPYEVASDSRITVDGHIVSDRYPKIFETEDLIIGAAGGAVQIKRIIDWILDGCDPEMKPIIPEDEPVLYEMAFLDKESGKLFMVEGRYIEVLEDIAFPVCLGSGGLLAQGSILQQMKDRPPEKVSAKEAIEVAKKIDTASGGRVKIIKVPQRPSKVGKKKIKE